MWRYFPHNKKYFDLNSSLWISGNIILHSHARIVLQYKKKIAHIQIVYYTWKSLLVRYKMKIKCVLYKHTFGYFLNSFLAIDFLRATSSVGSNMAKPSILNSVSPRLSEDSDSLFLFLLASSSSSFSLSTEVHIDSFCKLKYVQQFHL